MRPLIPPSSHDQLKHPGVVKVIEPLEENTGQMILVTERVVGSLRNIQTAFAAVPAAPESARSIRLNHLEVGGKGKGGEGCEGRGRVASL